jgi:hypothetical protein
MRAKTSYLPLMAFQLGEPLIEAPRAQAGLHGEHGAQRRYEVGVATQQRLRRLADVGCGVLECLSSVSAHA